MAKSYSLKFLYRNLYFYINFTCKIAPQSRNIVFASARYNRFPHNEFSDIVLTCVLAVIVIPHQKFNAYFVPRIGHSKSFWLSACAQDRTQGGGWIHAHYDAFLGGRCEIVQFHTLLRPGSTLLFHNAQFNSPWWSLTSEGTSFSHFHSAYLLQLRLATEEHHESPQASGLCFICCNCKQQQDIISLRGLSCTKVFRCFDQELFTFLSIHGDFTDKTLVWLIFFCCPVPLWSQQESDSSLSNNCANKSKKQHHQARTKTLVVVLSRIQLIRCGYQLPLDYFCCMLLILPFFIVPSKPSPYHWNRTVGWWPFTINSQRPVTMRCSQWS